MKKLLFSLIIFFILTTNSFTDHLKISSPINPFCENNFSQKNLEDIDKLKIDKIEIKTIQYRRWVRNSLNILIGNFRFIPEKFKNRFNANIVIKFENNLVCNFKGRIRFSGDQKDHVKLIGNSIVQSLDVHLRNGHIKGITKFKLLIPETRGNFEDEIFVTELLRDLNYLAPRTSYVNVEVNEVDSKMIFQEKAVKELLEFNHRREGPIFEGDERFLYRMIEAADLPDNQLSNLSIGVLPLMEMGVNATFAKQTNASWNKKSKKHAVISYNSLSNLNSAYLLYTNRYKDEKNDFYFGHYGLDNNLIALENTDNILKLDIYNLIVLGANGWHGLAPPNRKFYWNTIENFFEPINYDSNYNIQLEPTIFPLPVSGQIELAFNDLENLLSKINIKKFKQKVVSRGINLNEQQTKEKIDKLKKNLNTLMSIYSNIRPEILLDNRYSKINKKMWNKYYDSLYKISPNIYLTKQSPVNNSFKRCTIKPLACMDHYFSDEELGDLVGGQLVIDNMEYQYIGKNAESDDLFISSNYETIKFKDSYFHFNKNIKYSYDEEKKEFNIFQSKPGARAFFHKGTLENIKINFNGYKIASEQKRLDLQRIIHDLPIDNKGLTGCLSLINLKEKNLSLKGNGSSCEDTINLINVDGDINSVVIKDSLSDGLDIDFSRLLINDIDISAAPNDCLDLSYGNYKLINIRLSNCGDKALSVGEKSFLILDKINVNKADIGIAVKDSSNATIKNLDIQETMKCVNAYRKKQEFSGAIVNLELVNCHDGKMEKQAGSFINMNTL